MDSTEAMPHLFVVVVVIIFFFFFSHGTPSENNCSISFCGDKNTIIEFPFRLKNRQSRLCGYPGFDVACNSFGQIILHLPSSSGDLFIREINYITQEIRVYDPQNCLPRRILSNLNLSGSPFQGVYYQNYTFLNCSSEFVRSRFTPIACLSSSTHSVIATASMALAGFLSNNGNTCEIIKTVLVPAALPIQFEFWFSSDLHDDLRLTWREPDCGECAFQGGNCRFKNSKSLEIGCFDVPQRDHPTHGSLLTGLAVGFGLPAFMLTSALAIYLCVRTMACGRNDGGGPRQPNPATAGSAVTPQPSIAGLDEPTIDSYPKVVLGESCRLPRPDDATCPICLSEYRPKETLKLIPECKHCFHAECIDEWLHANATCPVCRNSPLPA